MDESRQIPTATSFRTLHRHRRSTADRKQLKAAGHKVSFTHLIAYAIARAATEQMPVMATHFAEIDGKPHVIDDGAVNLGIAVDVEKKGGGRTLMVPVIRDAGRLTFPQFLDAFDALIGKARENKLTADDLQGANVSLTNPGGIGTIASVPRLMSGQGTIVATGSIAYPPGLRHRRHDRRREGDDDDVDLRPSHHPGRRSGQFLQVGRGLPAGRARLLRAGLRRPRRGDRRRADAPDAGAGPPRARRPSRAPAVSAEPNLELLQAVQAATSLIKAHRTHGHLAARLDPLGSEPEGDPALDPEPLKLTPEIMARSRPRSCASASRARRSPTSSRTCARPTAARSPTRSSTSPRTASASGCARRSRPARFRKPLNADEKIALLRRLTQVDSLERFMHKAYLGQKQFSIEGLDMTVPMLDEMIQLAAVEGAREVVIGMADRGRLERARPQPRAARTRRSSASSRRLVDRGRDDDPAGRDRRRARPPRRPGHHQCGDADSVLVRLESNPSHLEYVGPVVKGATRAVQTTRTGTHATLDTNAASRSSCTATRPSPARASWRRRSTCRRSTATPSAARCT